MAAAVALCVNTCGVGGMVAGTGSGRVDHRIGSGMLIVPFYVASGLEYIFDVDDTTLLTRCHGSGGGG